MSSNIDEDCENIYSSPRLGINPVDDEEDNWSDNPANMIHSYVNVVDRSDSEEPKPALPARKDKSKAKPSTQRKSRSKDRERERARQTLTDYERIKEREKELERIHRRSRELMQSPRSLDYRGHDSSLERRKNAAIDHHHRMSANQPYFPHAPPPCNPPHVSAMPGQNRYKSPSPHDVSSTNRNTCMRKRVQSPNRNDYKDFSSHANREFISPHRTNSRFTDDEEDSGADSMNDLMSNQSNPSCHSWNPSHPHTSPAHMPMVPYNSRYGCRGCYSSEHSHCCSGSGYPYTPQNMQLAIPPSVEERLLALEGDKDQLHTQVAVLSDQIDSQTEKICDLERTLDDKKEDLKKTEDLLQIEMMNRSTLETTKLELMSEISSLKLKQTSTEKENLELRKRLQKTLHLSDSSTDGYRSLPRTPIEYREGSQHTHGGFRPISSVTGDKEKEMTPTRGATNFFHRSGSVRHSSVPTVGTRERDKSIERTAMIDVPLPKAGHGQQTPIATKPKGLKKILSKMRRSNSDHIPQANDDKKENEAVQDDYRASAGSRVAAGWELQKCSTTFNPNLPFELWDTDIICSWFDSMGLYMYSNDVKKSVKNGEQLAKFSSNDLEVKLGIKHLLHRKKVCLALIARQQKCEDPAGSLDHHWVIRWLDDVGLPQYKDTFLEARVDGRLLNFLTVDDLFSLKVSNLLHHLSIKRGIQVLRENNFEPSCLKRRGVPGSRDSQIVHTDVVFWTNHRVMEWLRHVDLSEYAPNLRGSGVHGSLMVFEKRFTAELLASLLSIPNSKTLLRRHLSIHVKALLGQEVIMEKRTAELEPNFQPLTPTSKAKQPKKGQFTLKRKKSKTEMDFEDMICPLGSP
eukprot:GFUD01067168.1.p1 GENE.GFUD01067168.1~~GFUD01067168.1.p1  ORF type:complete len:856 (+),score=209.17 GFUD01067168.1:124-2691(+)